MGMQDSERVVPDSQGGALVGDVGSCSLCGRPALWASSGRPYPARVLLEPGSGARVSVPDGITVVVASSAGQLSVVVPWTFRVHVCDPAVMSAVGDYSSDVLAVSCPVDSCLAPPGELCVSLRCQVFPRPHGARVALAAGQAWGDEGDHSTSSDFGE